jgi:hypothetical protein
MAWSGPALRSFVVVIGALFVALIADAMHLDGAARILVDVAAAVVVTVLGGLLLWRDIPSIAAARHGA